VWDLRITGRHEASQRSRVFGGKKMGEDASQDVVSGASVVYRVSTISPRRDAAN